MKLVVYSTSRPFEQFLSEQLDLDCKFCRQLLAPIDNADQLYLLHITGNEKAGLEWLLKFVSGKPVHVGVCADRPDIREMLECVRLGAKAYCNSHMAKPHYQQMVQLLSQGQSWFAPQMLDETFEMARQAVINSAPRQSLEVLTRREKQVALAVGDGKSNRQIADLHGIKEPTVKRHLSNIFKKLELKDRVGLVIYLKQA